MVALRETVGQFSTNHGAARVMVAGATTGPFDNFFGVLRTDDHNGATHGDGNFLTDGALASAQSAGEQLHHTDVAL